HPATLIRKSESRYRREDAAKLVQTERKSKFTCIFLRRSLSVCASRLKVQYNSELQMKNA
ncbi:MAG: hypothetical protein IKK87_11080, partial [Bacteroidaceae bacterium]|nr:hypothetical protein [Bacteroidaceae bacterium]